MSTVGKGGALGKEPSSCCCPLYGRYPGHEKTLSLKAPFIVFFLVAEHTIIYKTLKVVVLNLLAYERDFVFLLRVAQAPGEQV